MIESIKLFDGEYEVQLIDNGRKFKALKNGLEWRDLAGDNLVLAMFYKIQELEEELKDKTEQVDECIDWIENLESEDC